MLEIGIWQLVRDLDKRALMKPAMADHPEAVRKCLVKHATERLPFYAGSTYSDFVLFCLNGKLISGYEEEQRMLKHFLDGIDSFYSLADGM